MKKGVFTVVLLFILAAVVFYFGFLNIKVPSDKFAVMTSRTSGVYDKPIENGVFAWRWEFLIPKNAELSLFNKTSYLMSKTVSGTLPSSEIYSEFAYGNPDFSYSFEYVFYLNLKPEKMIELVKNGTVSDETTLSVLMNDYTDRLANDITDRIITSGTASAVSSSVDMKTLAEELSLDEKYPEFTIDNIFIRKSSYPDMELYNSAKKSYSDYQSLVDEKLAEYASVQAERIMSDTRTVQKLSQLGDVLKKYPELAGLLSNGDSAAVINALNNLR